MSNIQNNNLILINALNEYLRVMPDQIDPKTLEEVKASGVRELYAYASLLNSYMGLDEMFIDRYLLNMLIKDDVDKYLNNPFYLKMDNLEQAASGKLKLDYSFIEQYELFAQDEIDTAIDGRIYPQIAYFDDFLKCVTIYDHEKILSRFNPLAVNACIIPLDEVKGKVACFGLGNGYFAYMAHLKDNVSALTIYEANNDLIELFKKGMLPKFDYPEKIKIVKADPFMFLKNKTNKLSVDYAFINCWSDYKTGAKDYHRFKKLEANRPKVKYMYYLENSILAYPKEEDNENS